MKDDSAHYRHAKQPPVFFHQRDHTASFFPRTKSLKTSSRFKSSTSICETRLRERMNSNCSDAKFSTVMIIPGREAAERPFRAGFAWRLIHPPERRECVWFFPAGHP